MNILIITAMFPPVRTGTSFYSKNLAETFTGHGHNVLLITCKNKESDNDNYNFKVKRISALHFPLKNFFKHLRVTSLLPWNYWAVLKETKKHKADVIFLVNHYLDIAFLAVFASKVRRIPLVVSVGTQLQSLNPLRDRIMNILDRLICGNLVFKFSKKIVSWDREIHRYIKDVHSQNNVKKSIIIPYGVNGKINSFINYKYNALNKKQIIGVGAIIEQRNFLFLIRVFNEIVKKFKDIKLKIIGHVYYDAPVALVKELGISDKVIFTGELSHDEVLKELKRSLIYWGAATGKYVGLGTATIEAMLMSVPVISNVPENLIGQPILHDMENFIYTDGRALSPLLKKIENLFQHKNLLQEIGQNGRKFVRQNLNWDIVADKLESLFNKII